MNYYLAGYLFGAGSKKRAAQTDIWRELRGQANLGLCDCEWMQKKFDSAIVYCQRALTYIPKDMFANYRLGIIYSEKFNQANQLGLLAAAKTHFSMVIAANPDASEADRARKYIKNIDQVMAQQ
jgi:tetratricopeptide (TPR) repeat protein